jgi:hypothetical protein
VFAQSIDSKEVTAANLIPLLRGNDVVGSHVLIVVKKGDTSQHETFNLQRFLLLPPACVLVLSWNIVSSASSRTQIRTPL